MIVVYVYNQFNNKLQRHNVVIGSQSLALPFLPP